jgi:hypothetical protein
MSSAVVRRIRHPDKKSRTIQAVLYAWLAIPVFYAGVSWPGTMSQVAIESRNGESIGLINRQPTGQWLEYPAIGSAHYYTMDFLESDYGWAFGNALPAVWDGEAWIEWAAGDDLAGYVISARILSRTDGWAVGHEGRIFHWNGEDWATIQAPTESEDVLYDVDFVSPTLGWAVGARQGVNPAEGLLLRWNGREWSHEAAFPNDPLLAIDMFSETEGWIAGSTTAMFHWNGANWESHNNAALYGSLFTSIAVVAESEAWMVGNIVSDNSGTIWKWDGQQWFEFARTVFGLYSVSMSSRDWGWAVGGNGRNARGGNLILHWNGRTWEEQQSPVAVPLVSVWALGERDGWILGGGPNVRVSSEYHGVVLRYQSVTSSSTSPPPNPTLSSSIPSTRTPESTRVSTAIPSTTATATRPSANPIQQPVSNWIGPVALITIIMLGLAVLFLRRRR